MADILEMVKGKVVYAEDVLDLFYVASAGQDKAFIEIVEDVIQDTPAADVVEVKHGKWHIMPEYPYDESGYPTEEGWYRIITTDGDEMTDYYFNKPTICGRGVVYWEECEKRIRAWAKMDGTPKERGTDE